MSVKANRRTDRSARGAKPLEVIGTYNPIPKKPTNLYDENANARPYKEIALDRARAKYWLGVGAQPSDPVWKLMGMVSSSRFFGAFPGEMYRRVWFPDGLHTTSHFCSWGNLPYFFAMRDRFADMGIMCRLALLSRSPLPFTRHNGVSTVPPSGLFNLANTV
jgi:ribosomal protein S16